MNGQGHDGPGHGGPQHQQHQERRECGPEDRIDHSARQWRRAFDDALHELRVELVKKEIRAIWGAQLEATAKGAADAMREDWKKYWSEHGDDLEPEVKDAGSKVRDVIRAEIKKTLGGMT